MQPIYEQDIIWSAQRVALRALAKYERAHPEFESLGWLELVELRNKLLRRAFEPKCGVKIVKRLMDRGNELSPGEGPERATTKRMRARFCSALHAAVAAASARLEGA